MLDPGPLSPSLLLPRAPRASVSSLLDAAAYAQTQTQTQSAPSGSSQSASLGTSLRATPNTSQNTQSAVAPRQGALLTMAARLVASDPDFTLQNLEKQAQPVDRVALLASLVALDADADSESNSEYSIHNEPLLLLARAVVRLAVTSQSATVAVYSQADITGFAQLLKDAVADLIKGPLSSPSNPSTNHQHQLQPPNPLPSETHSRIAPATSAVLAQISGELADYFLAQADKDQARQYLAISKTHLQLIDFTQPENTRFWCAST